MRDQRSGFAKRRNRTITRRFVFRVGDYAFEGVQSLFHVPGLDIVERFVGRILQLAHLAVVMRLVGKLGVRRIEARGDFIFAPGAFLVAQVLVNMSERFMRVEQIGIGLDRFLEFVARAFQVALLEQIFGRIKMAFGLRHTSGEAGNGERRQCGGESGTLSKSSHAKLLSQGLSP